MSEELNEQQVWLNWCRLCASDEAGNSVRDKHGYASLISKCFDVEIEKEQPALGGMLCDQCDNFVADLIQFTKNVTKVQPIFELLRHTEPNDDVNVTLLREQYGLSISDNGRRDASRESTPELAPSPEPALLKRKRGRPRKVQVEPTKPQPQIQPQPEPLVIKRKRGRPRKHIEEVQYENNDERFRESTSRPTRQRRLSYYEHLDDCLETSFDTASSYPIEEEQEVYSRAPCQTRQNPALQQLLVDSDDPDAGQAKSYFMSKVSLSQKKPNRRLQELLDDSDDNNSIHITYNEVDAQDMSTHDNSRSPESKDLPKESEYYEKLGGNRVNMKNEEDLDEDVGNKRNIKFEEDDDISYDEGDISYDEQTDSEDELKESADSDDSYSYSNSNQAKRVGHQKKVESLETEDAPGETSHRCNICRKELTSEAGLRAHYKRIHAKVKLAICDCCGKQFNNRTELAEHMLVHTDEKPCECTICGKSFKNKRRLRLHSQSHGSPSFECHVCGKKLQTRATLAKHKTVHTNERRFKCNICGTASKNSSALKAHFLSHAGIRPYGCRYCDKTFSSRVNCKNHMERQHSFQAEHDDNAVAARFPVPHLDQLRAITATMAQAERVRKETKLLK